MFLQIGIQGDSNIPLNFVCWGMINYIIKNCIHTYLLIDTKCKPLNSQDFNFPITLPN